MNPLLFYLVRLSLVALLLLSSFGGMLLAQQESKVSFNFPNVRAVELLAEYERLSGKRLIRDATGGPEQLTLVARDLTREEALRLLESTLLFNGIAFVPMMDGSLKVLNLLSGRSPRGEGIPLYSEASQLPKGDYLVSFHLPLRFLKPEAARTLFEAHINTAARAYASIVAAPNSQALVLTDTTSAIRQVLDLQRLVDVPLARLETEFISLQRADAERVAEAVNAVLGLGGARGAGAAGSAPAGAGASGDVLRPDAEGGRENQLVAGQTQIVADARTNRLLVVTRSQNLPMIRALVEEFDTSVSLSEPFTRPLQYVKASEIFNILTEMLRESDKDPASTPGTGGANAANAQGGRGQQAGRSAGSSNATQLQTRLEQSLEQPPQVSLVGKTRLIADDRINSIIVIGPPESKERVRLIVDRLDQKPKQVYLATVVGKLRLTNNAELSVDLIQKFSTYTGDSGVATGSQNSPTVSRLDPRTLVGASNFPAAAGALTVYGALGSTLDYFIRALETTGRFSVLSRPSVFTENNKLAIISSGQEVPVPETTQSSLGSGSTNTTQLNATISFKRVALLLEVQPLINSKREVNLRVSQQNQTVAGSTTISGNAVPIVAEDRLETTVTVPDRGTVVLGGLIRDADDKTRTGVPWLSRIPLLGALFRSDTATKTREELVIMIQPIVIESDEELAQAQAADRERSKVQSQSETYMETPKAVTEERVPSVKMMTE